METDANPAGSIFPEDGQPIKSSVKPSVKPSEEHLENSQRIEIHDF